MKLIDFIKNNIVLLDGATGSLMQKAGFPSGLRPESANITAPEMLVDIHKSYFDAGSNIVVTNTFGANLLNFYADELNRIIAAGIKNAKEASILSTGKQPKFVSYDMGPSGKMTEPFGDLPFEKAVELFAYQAKLAEKYGADLISIETMSDSYETKAALLAVKENCSLPVFVTNAYGEDGRLLTGATPQAMTAMLEGLGADAVGLNCSYGPDKLYPVIKQIYECASIPVIFKPNAGMPRVENGETVYDINPTEFSEGISAALELGVNIVGGCCGSTPEYISELSKLISSKKFKPITNKNFTVVSSYSDAVVFVKKPVIIGERINPTGKKLIKQALTENNIDYLLKEGNEQKKRGADILDVNCGMPEIDEKSVLPSVVFELQSVCNLPLQIDTSDITAMENALRLYNGKAMINSVNGKAEVMSKVFPLAKKYGGVTVALTLDENGIPQTAAGRLEIAEKIIAEAEKYGISKNNLVFDPLTLTVSADADAANVTLEAVKLITEKTGCKTVLGVSNVSFGLPQRSKINSVFFTLAMNNGLSAAIINPMSEDMMNAYYSFLALKGLDFAFRDYIGAMSGEEKAVYNKSTIADDTDLKRAIIEGRKEAARKLTEQLIKEKDALSVVNDEIVPALDTVGVNYEAKKAFLPELLLSAEAAKSCFEVIKASFKDSKSEKNMTIVIATVKGDIHDIGKNIVKLLLENYGYRVIDLGKDVEAQDILKAAKESRASIVGLSALMTTTVPAMKDTIELIHSQIPGCRVMVGGAVLTAEYASQIKADAYASDAMNAVRYAEEIYNAGI